MKCHNCQRDLVQRKGVGKSIYLTCSGHSYITIENNIITYYAVYYDKYSVSGRNYNNEPVYSEFSGYNIETIRLGLFLPLEHNNKTYDYQSVIDRFKILNTFS